MSLHDKMIELKFDKRTIYKNKDYDTEYFTFNKANAVKALCYLIDNANHIVEIHHRPISTIKEYLDSNPVLKSLSNNKKIQIRYYTNNISEKQKEILKEYMGNHVTTIDLNLNKTDRVEYHHKEMTIDNKYTIITSMNFLTNTATDGTSHWLENFSIWIKKRSEK